jgi:hypothetical protein
MTGRKEADISPPGFSRRQKALGRWWAPGDVILVLAVVALSALLIAHGVASAGTGARREIRVTASGREVLRLPLDKDADELTVTGYAGESYLEIREGRVHMVDSACPDKLCVKTGWISSPGESIVCLPNRVVIEITSGDGGPDVVNQ